MDTGAQDHKLPRWLVRIAIGSDPVRTLTRVAVLILLSLVVFNFVLWPIKVDGISMLPTYHEGNVNFINRLAFLFRPPHRGDIVSIRYAGKHRMLLKRVIGLPGETVAFHDGHLVINGQPMEEPYVKYQCDWEIPAEQVGPGEYYVVGDNRSMPDAGHVKGRATRDRIMGKVLL